MRTGARKAALSKKQGGGGGGRGGGAGRPLEGWRQRQLHVPPPPLSASAGVDGTARKEGATAVDGSGCVSLLFAARARPGGRSGRAWRERLAFKNRFSRTNHPDVAGESASSSARDANPKPRIFNVLNGVQCSLNQFRSSGAHGTIMAGVGLQSRLGRSMQPINALDRDCLGQLTVDKNWSQHWTTVFPT